MLPQRRSGPRLIQGSLRRHVLPSLIGSVVCATRTRTRRHRRRDTYTVAKLPTLKYGPVFWSTLYAGKGLPHHAVDSAQCWSPATFKSEKDSAGFVDSKENKWVGSWLSWSKEGTVRHRQSKEASILWSHREETRELLGERDNARNNARCTQARKTTHGLDGQHQDVDRTLRGRVNQKDRGQR